MNDLRKEFEEIAEIKQQIRIGNVEFVGVDEGIYGTNNTDNVSHNSCCFVNGAWFAFQEQQKKIDAIKQHVVSFYAEADFLWGFDSDQAIRQIDLIQELLK